MSEINFEADDPLWQVDIHHRNPGASPIWPMVLNAADEKSAIKKAIALFDAAGLNITLIDMIQPWRLQPLEGGEPNG